MPKFNIASFVSASPITKIQINTVDMSVQGIGLTGCIVSFFAESNLDVREIGFDFFTAFRELSVPYLAVSHTLNIEAIASNDNFIVRNEIREFLHNIQISLTTALFNEDQLSDEEIEYIDSVYPDINYYDLDRKIFCAQPFINLESTDTTTNTTTGIINELMYQFTDKLIPETIFNLVQTYFNTDAVKANFTEFTSGIFI